MGHALFLTIQDAIVRHKRASGFSTLWLPGTDHAGLATHARIMERLGAAGLKPTPGNYDREAGNWLVATGTRITDQIRRMGASCDWSRERFTLDDRYARSVDEAFHRLDAQGRIRRRDGQTWLDVSDLAARLLALVEAGAIRIVPEHGGKALAEFLRNIEPWCISRQIRWGHRLPGTDEVLDTWFSSALWPFAIHGWPEATPDLARYYPAAMIETADDIVFFWCARMMMLSLALTDRMPFDTIYLHGIVRDELGRKMSKSLGNGIDPIVLVDRYGCDAVRMGLMETCTPGQDVDFSHAPFESARRFVDKLWQASRFVAGHIERMGPAIASGPTHPDDARLAALTTTASGDVRRAMDALDLRSAAHAVRHHVRDTYCDWYIEAAKGRLRSGDRAALSSLSAGMDAILSMSHPMMPFVTDRIAEGLGLPPPSARRHRGAMA